MTKKRWNFLDEIRVERENMKKEINRLDKRLEQLHPAWCEYWRKAKRKERLERELKKQHF